MASVRKQSLRQNFETIQDYCSRVVSIVNQIRGLGYKLGAEEVVAKVLRSLHPKFDFVAVVIEETKDITTLTLDELSGSLQAHELRVNRSGVKVGERALHVKGEATGSSYNKGATSSSGNTWGESRGRGRPFARSRGRGRAGRGRAFENKSNVQCFHCKKFGHVKAECWAREKQPERGVTLIVEEKEANNLFMASSSSEEAVTLVWLVDSGCLNHMTGDRSLFSYLDESQKVSVRLGNNKEMLVHGVGAVSINTQGGEQKQLQGVQFVPGLPHNLLSVGQLLTKGYTVVFNHDECIISHNKNRNHVITI